jgi:ATP-dependent Clp protease ATP-binding subunit ClpA
MPFLNDLYAENQRAINARASGSGPAAGTASTASAGPDLGAVADRVAGRIRGQDAVVELLARRLRLIKTGLADPERPMLSMLLVGPTGVGKTELVRQVAAGVRGGPDDLCRVDMSTFAQEHYAAAFAGAPPGYAGSREGLSSFDPDTAEGTAFRPGIVLFDEVEKAHPVVLRALLGILDTGRLRLANGQRIVNLRRSMVFLTSNLGSRETAARRGRWTGVLAHQLGRGVGLAGRTESRVAQRAVRRFFDPEFLNRLDEIAYFEELTPRAAEEIVHLELARLRARAERSGVELRFDPDVVHWLRRHGFDPVYGARSLRRTIDRQVADRVAAHLLDGAAVTDSPERAGVPSRLRVTVAADDLRVHPDSSGDPA